MSNYNWCHGTNCHTQHTLSRIRGTGDNKVLRTRKIKFRDSSFAMDNGYNYFCNQSCLMAFINTHLQAIIAIAPRRQPLETPIKVKKWKEERYRYRWSGSENRRVPYQGTRTEITSE